MKISRWDNPGINVYSIPGNLQASWEIFGNRLFRGIDHWVPLIHIQIYFQICIQTYFQIYIQIHMQIHIQTYIQIHIQICIQIYNQIHIQIYIDRGTQWSLQGNSIPGDFLAGWYFFQNKIDIGLDIRPEVNI